MAALEPAAPGNQSDGEAAPSWMPKKLLAQYRARGDAERVAIFQQGRADTNRIFERLLKQKNAKDREKHPSYEKIPRFFAPHRAEPPRRAPGKGDVASTCAEEVKTGRIGGKLCPQVL